MDESENEMLNKTLSSNSPLRESLKLALKIFSQQYESSTAQNLEPSIVKLQALMGQITRRETGFELAHLQREAPVTYIELFDSTKYSSLVSGSIFGLQENSQLPLHNHPNMHGFIKCIYGGIAIESYTPQISEDYSRDSTLIKTKVLSSTVLTECDDKVAVVRPVIGNIHAIKSIGGPAAFIDFITPPYASYGKLSCTYYEKIIDCDLNSEILLLRKVPCPRWYFCERSEYFGPDLSDLLVHN